jgi:hypothetical protein
MTSNSHDENGAAYLAWLMRRRGLSSPRLADLAGEVSGSAIRYYVRDEAIPREDKAKAIAVLFGPGDGEKLLRLWGHTDLADGFAADFSAMLHGHEDAVQALLARNRIEYDGEPLTEVQVAEAELFIDFVRNRDDAR